MWHTLRTRMNHLGDIIRDAREKRGLGVRALAREAKVDPSSISKLERHEQHTLNPDNFARVAQALGTTVDQLLAKVGEDRNRPVDWPTVEEVIKQDPNTTEVQKETLIQVYRSYVD